MGRKIEIEKRCLAGDNWFESMVGEEFGIRVWDWLGKVEIGD